MKESSGKTKKLSKGVRRARSMRNVVMMVLVCVLMLSAATYAWFTLSTSAKVANLSMKVGEETSLLIAPDISRDSNAGTPGQYGSALNFGEPVKDASGNTSTVDGDYDYYKIDAALLPSTLIADGTVMKPVYNEDDGTIITGFENTDSILMDKSFKNDATSTAGDYYCYRTTFYLKTAGAEDVKVCLKSPEASNGMNETTAPKSGTYIINSGDKQGAAAIRIRLSATNNGKTEEIIYEPLQDSKIDTTTESATIADTANEPTALTATDVQPKNGVFTSNTGRITVTTEGTRVTMEVWVEGSDPQCVNQIMGSDIEGVLAFEVAD